MTSCTYCGADVTGKKFCAGCGHAVQAAGPSQTVNTSCPQCGEKVNPGAAYCMHCGTPLHAQATPISFSATRSCPSCQAQVARESAFCNNCGHDMRTGSASSPMQHCNTCGQSNASGMRFCGGCGSPLGTPTVSQPYNQPQQYQQPGSQPYSQPQQYQQQNPQPYNQPQQYQQPGSQPYGQPQYQQQYNNQGGYQPQPMMGQGQMVLRCPVCMAMAPVGSSNCRGCQTSLLNIVPTPANMAPQGQQGGGFLQGNIGKYAAGAAGGAIAVIGGEMLLNGLENSIENRVEGDMGYGENRHRRHHHQRENEGILGELGRLANDVGL